jgi:hypothetical protein
MLDLGSVSEDSLDLEERAIAWFLKVRTIVRNGYGNIIFPYCHRLLDINIIQQLFPCSRFFSLSNQITKKLPNMQLPGLGRAVTSSLLNGKGRAGRALVLEDVDVDMWNLQNQIEVS